MNGRAHCLACIARRLMRAHCWCSVVAAVRTRAAAEPHFRVKLLAAAALDVAAVLLVNYAARRGRFRAELRPVACQVRQGSGLSW